MNEALALLGSGIAGLVGGIFYGFCMAAHTASVGGYVAEPNGRLLSLLTAINLRLTFERAVVLLVFMVLSLALFAACAAAPALLASRLAPAFSTLVPIAYAALGAGGAIGWRFGKHLWKGVS